MRFCKYCKNWTHLQFQACMKHRDAWKQENAFLWPSPDASDNLELLTPGSLPTLVIQVLLAPHLGPAPSTPTMSSVQSEPTAAGRRDPLGRQAALKHFLKHPLSDPSSPGLPGGILHDVFHSLGGQAWWGRLVGCRFRAQRCLPVPFPRDGDPHSHHDCYYNDWGQLPSLGPIPLIGWPFRPH